MKDMTGWFRSVSRKEIIKEYPALSSNFKGFKLILTNKGYVIKKGEKYLTFEKPSKVEGNVVLASRPRYLKDYLFNKGLVKFKEGKMRW